MEDRLKEYIQKERAGFDNIESIRKELIWKGIEQNQDAFNLNRWKLFSIVLIGLMLAGIFYFFMQDRFRSEPDDLSPIIMAQLSSLSKDYDLLSKSMISTINLAALKDQRFQELLSELNHLDERYSELLEDVKKFGLTEDLIARMIKYHERKLRLLELLSKEKEYQNLEKIKEYEM